MSSGWKGLQSGMKTEIALSEDREQDSQSLVSCWTSTANTYSETVFETRPPHLGEPSRASAGAGPVPQAQAASHNFHFSSSDVFKNTTFQNKTKVWSG